MYIIKPHAASTTRWCVHHKVVYYVTFLVRHAGNKSKRIHIPMTMQTYSPGSRSRCVLFGCTPWGTNCHLLFLVAQFIYLYKKCVCLSCDRAGLYSTHVFSYTRCMPYFIQHVLLIQGGRDRYMFAKYDILNQMHCVISQCRAETLCTTYAITFEVSGEYIARYGTVLSTQFIWVTCNLILTSTHCFSFTLTLHMCTLRTVLPLY
jgi:hypothetical protein